MTGITRIFNQYSQTILVEVFSLRDRQPLFLGQVGVVYENRAVQTVMDV